MKDIMLDNKRIACLSPSGVATINKSMSRHLYRKLNAFCINEILFRDVNIHAFLFSTALEDYFITKQTICEFKEYYNPYLSFNGERQLALPLIIMNCQNKMTGEETSGIATSDFIDKGKYSGWSTRKVKKNV